VRSPHGRDHVGSPVEVAPRGWATRGPSPRCIMLGATYVPLAFSPRPFSITAIRARRAFPFIRDQ
jgi:hypothetical protein